MMSAFFTKRFFTMVELIIVMTMIALIAGFATLFIGDTIFKYIVAEQSADVTHKVQFVMQRIIKELRQEGAYQGISQEGKRLSFYKNENDSGTDYIQYNSDNSTLRLFHKNTNSYLLLDSIISGTNGVVFTALSSGAVKIQINTTADAGYRTGETVNDASFEIICFPR